MLYDKMPYVSCRIDDQNLIKVADFGLAEEVYARNYFRQTRASNSEGKAPVKLPVKWMALESLHDGMFSEKTDVVSVLHLELVKLALCFIYSGHLE